MNFPALAFQVSTIWALLWFATGALDLPAALYSAFFTGGSGQFAVNLTFWGFASKLFYQLLRFGFY